MLSIGEYRGQVEKGSIHAELPPLSLGGKVVQYGRNCPTPWPFKA